jgi:hypothetical protein
MKPINRWLCVLALLLLFTGGCTSKAQQTPAPKSVSRQAGLPSWAPENPSPEFLRAAKFLKAIPPEAQPYSAEYIPCWELFGSLTNEQIAEFMRKKQMSFSARDIPKGALDSMVKDGDRVEGGRIISTYRGVHLPMKSLSPRQKELFNKYVAVYTGYNQSAKKPDLLVELYHAGAKQDLSNVALYFQTTGHMLHFFFGGTDRPFPLIESGPVAQVIEPKAPQPQKKKRPR